MGCFEVKIVGILLVLMGEPLFLRGDFYDKWQEPPNFYIPQRYIPPTLSPRLGTTTRSTTTASPAQGQPEEMGSVFDTSFVTNVTAQQGKTAHLQCRILISKKNKPQVSWIRRRDWHILSVGEQVFTQDQRFQLLHEDVNDWTLRIKFLQKRDEGTYVCQVPTRKGVQSHYFNLVVSVPSAFILGTEEYHTQAGGMISLVCIIENSLEPPPYVFWYHNGNLINYDTVSRISIATDPGPKTHSRLMISDVNKDDSGNYTCNAPNTESSTVDVFVSPGDKTLYLSNCSSFPWTNPILSLTLWTCLNLASSISGQ